MRGGRWLVSTMAAGAALAAPAAADAAVCNGVLNNPGCPNVQRIPVFPAREDAPLKRGFLDDYILREPGRYAKEIYHLVGARPNTTYQVFLVIHINTGTCQGGPPPEGPGPPTRPFGPITQPSTYMRTSADGNRKATIVAPGPTPENPGGPPPAPAIQNLLNSIRWEWRRSDGTVDYHTNCIPVFENPPKEEGEE